MVSLSKPHAKTPRSAIPTSGDTDATHKNQEPAWIGGVAPTVDLGGAVSEGQREALGKLREFLEDCWQWSHHVHYDTGFRRSETKPEVASTFMCRHTARVLLELLADVDPGWRLAGGTMATNDGRSPEPHWWIENDHAIVDLTADQFGWGEMTVAPVHDARYERQKHACHGKWINGLTTVIDQWKGKASRDWMENDPRFQDISQRSGPALLAFGQQWRDGMVAKPESKAGDEARTRKTRQRAP